jgi:PAS domain-containing protein
MVRSEKGDNLTEAVEQYLSNSINSADEMLLLARSYYQTHQDEQGFLHWIRQSGLAETAFRVSLIGIDGKIKVSSTGTQVAGLDVSDRDYFQTHTDGGSDQLFISRPLNLRATGRWSIIISRRVNLNDGTFAGVINAAFDYDRLEQFLPSLDLDNGGFVALIGIDGVIRARTADRHLLTGEIGRSLADGTVLQLYKQAPSGHNWTAGGVSEQSRRLVTYRLVKGFPLIVLVSQAEPNILAQTETTHKAYYGFGGAIAIVVLVAAAFGIARTRTLTIATETLRVTNARFFAALAHMSQGLCMFDREQRLLVSNDRFADLYGVPSDLLAPGCSLSSILEQRKA